MQYNVNNASVKRILREVKEMEAEPSSQYTAAPLEDNIFEWHFTIRGPKDTEFEGGLYHGRIILPPEYPFKPPNIVLLNESGRFEVGTKICLSISSYHPEHWQPSWSIRTVLVALISFMPTKGDGAIGAIDLDPQNRKVIAKKSINFKCDKCGAKVSEVLPPEEPTPSREETEATSDVSPAASIDAKPVSMESIQSSSEVSSSSSSSPSANTTTTTTNTTHTSTVTTHERSAAQTESTRSHTTHDVPHTAALPLPQPLAQAHATPLAHTHEHAHVAAAARPSGSGQSLDYAILVVLFALVALIVRKFAAAY